MTIGMPLKSYTIPTNDDGEIVAKIKGFTAHNIIENITRTRWDPNNDAFAVHTSDGTKFVFQDGSLTLIEIIH